MTNLRSGVAMLRVSTTGMTAKNVMLWSWNSVLGSCDHPEQWWWELLAPQGGRVLLLVPRVIHGGGAGQANHARQVAIGFGVIHGATMHVGLSVC